MMTTVLSSIPGMAPLGGGEQCDLLTPHKQNNGVNIPTKLVVKDHDAQTLPTCDETNTAGGDTAEGGNTTLPAEIEGGPNTYSNHRDDAFITESNLDMVVQNMKQYIEHLEEEKCEMQVLFNQKQVDVQVLTKKLKKQKIIRKKLKKVLRIKKKTSPGQQVVQSAQSQASALGFTNVRRWTLNVPSFGRPRQQEAREESESCYSIGVSSDGSLSALEGISTGLGNSVSSRPTVIEEKEKIQEDTKEQDEEVQMTGSLREEAKQLVCAVSGKIPSTLLLDDDKLKADCVRLLRVINGREHSKLTSRNIMIGLQKHALVLKELEDVKQDNTALSLISALAFEPSQDKEGDVPAIEELGIKISIWKKTCEIIENSYEKLIDICQQQYDKTLQDLGNMENEEDITNAIQAKNELYNIIHNSYPSKTKVQEMEAELERFRDGVVILLSETQFEM